MKHKPTRTLDRVMATELTKVTGGYDPEITCNVSPPPGPGPTGTTFNSWDGTWYSVDGCDED